MSGAAAKTSALDIWTFRNENATTFSLSLPSSSSRRNFSADSANPALRNELLAALRLKKGGSIGHHSGGKEEEEQEPWCGRRVRQIVTPKVLPAGNSSENHLNNNNNTFVEGDDKESECGTQNHIRTFTAANSAQSRIKDETTSMTRVASGARNNVRARDDRNTRMAQTREEVAEAADLLLHQSLVSFALHVKEGRGSTLIKNIIDNDNNKNNGWHLVPSSHSSSSPFAFYRPHYGEPSCFVNCSALANQPIPTINSDDNVIDDDTGDVDSMNEEDGPHEARARGHRATAIDTLERSNIRPPHSLGARKSCRGLAFDCTRHELPVRDGDRIERAGRFWGELRDAGVSVRGIGDGNGHDKRRIAASQWTTVNPDDALRGVVGAADMTEDQTTTKINQTLASAVRTNSGGIDVFTVTSTEKGDRHGANRYFHRNGLGEGAWTKQGAYTKKFCKNNNNHDDEVALPFSSASVHANKKWRHSTGGPSNHGASYALGSELELNRLRALQSRVLDDGEEDDPPFSSSMAMTMYETTHGDIGGQNDEMRRARLRSLQQQQQHDQIKMVTAAKKGNLWLDERRNIEIDFEGGDYRYQRAVEETALMGDLIEVRDEAFKITALPIPNLRVETMEKSARLRSAKSQKELARTFRMGGGMGM